MIYTMQFLQFMFMVELFFARYLLALGLRKHLVEVFLMINNLSNFISCLQASVLGHQSSLVDILVRILHKALVDIN